MTDQDKNMVLYVGTYPDEASANADYEALVELHKEGWVGSYDVGLVVKDADGKVKISRHTDSTGEGARKGLAIGAVVGLIFPPSIIAGGAIGAGVGAAIGHNLNDVSKDDLKELGTYIQDSEASLVVIGELKIEEMINKAFANAVKEYKKEFNADVDDYNKQLDALVDEANK